MGIVYTCDECGRVVDPVTKLTTTITGRVLIDGVDNNVQMAILCDDHTPRSWDGLTADKWQPHNCQHVKFYWPGYVASPDLDETQRLLDLDKLDGKDEVEIVWENSWADLIMPGGVLNLDQLKRELYDFRVVMVEVGKVYDAVTGGRFSKPNTPHEAIIEAADAHHLNNQIEEDDELNELIEDDGSPSIFIKIKGLEVWDRARLRDQLALVVAESLIDNSGDDD